MFRWLIRFSGAALVGALLVWFWNRYNQDLLDEELEEEIPLEFDVPEQDESSSSPAMALASGSTGNGAASAEAQPVAAAARSTQEAAATAPEAAPGAEETEGAAPEAASDAEEAVLPTNPEPVLDSPAPTPEGAGDNVIMIKGIGPKYAEKLAELGITTFGALLATPRDDLAIAFPRVSDAELDNWLEQARELAAQSDASA